MSKIFFVLFSWINSIRGIENLNHDEYVEEEDYYNVDSDESDIDANE